VDHQVCRPWPAYTDALGGQTWPDRPRFFRPWSSTRTVEFICCESFDRLELAPLPWRSSAWRWSWCFGARLAVLTPPFVG